MPTMTYCGEEITFASVEDVLGFANKVREVGGANALEALLPATPGDENSCLIAVALNFGCAVLPLKAYPDARIIATHDDGSQWWAMLTPNEETARRVATVDGCKLIRVYERQYLADQSEALRDGGQYEYAVLLPKEIGNAASAFDYNHPEFDQFNLHCED